MAVLSSYICAGIAGCVVNNAAVGGAPIVDLGYGLWQGTINTTGQYYNFSNIRYGQPPVGNLRFAEPQKPLSNRTTVNDGQDGRICIQGYPSWNQERQLFVEQYTKNPNNISAFAQSPAPGIDPAAKPPAQKDGRATEDCLFLDVIVPKTVYDNTNKSSSTTGSAPVMVWLYGGGFYEGYKDSQGSPAGFVGQSITNPATAPGIVYVAINYRLGAFGWLSGPSFTASGGTPNAGLLDQRLALDWIQENIHLFGGDPKKVTLMGESAGGSSTLHHITAYGGSKGDAPFQQGVIISPAFNPTPYNVAQEATFKKYLAAVNVTTLAQLRAAPSELLVRANEATIWAAVYGSSGGYGPVVDGNYVPQLPDLLLASGRYAKNVKNVLAGRNTDEGLIFTNPAVQNNTAFNALVNSSSSLLLPDAIPSVRDMVAGTLYPPPNGTNSTLTLGYNDTISRLATLIADQILNCNVQAAMDTFGANKSYAWLFSEGAGLHGEDTPYMFYNYGPETDAYGPDFGMVNGTVANALQNWVLTFGATGNPNGKGNYNLPVYGTNMTMGTLSNKGIGLPVKDPATKQRCDFWRQALYY